MKLQNEKLQAQNEELKKAMISITKTPKAKDIPTTPSNVIFAGPVKEVIQSKKKINISEEVKAYVPVKFIEESKHDSKRDLAYERFKKERLVEQDYFILNT